MSIIDFNSKFKYVRSKNKPPDTAIYLPWEKQQSGFNGTGLSKQSVGLPILPQREKNSGGAQLPPKQSILPPKRPILPPKRPLLPPKQPILPPKQPILPPKQPILPPKRETNMPALIPMQNNAKPILPLPKLNFPQKSDISQNGWYNEQYKGMEKVSAKGLLSSVMTSKQLGHIHKVNNDVLKKLTDEQRERIFNGENIFTIIDELSPGLQKTIENLSQNVFSSLSNQQKTDLLLKA